AFTSWAVPKGPTLDPSQKRLAVMVEEHPLDYGSFEGVLPEGEYGAGEVIVWDRGTYSPEESGQAPFDSRAQAEEEMRRGLAAGKVSFILNGEKLRGSWALVKTRRGRDWLLIKHRDAAADPGRDVLGEDRSVLSGLTIEDLKAGSIPEVGDSRTTGEPLEQLAGAKKAAFPRVIAPMLATLTDAPFSHSDWLFEPKLDGVRAIALVKDRRVRLLSRRGNDVSKGYPSLADELSHQPEAEMVLDGEIVALDQEGRPSFERLQQRLNLTGEPEIHRAEAQVPVIYYVFDLLYLRGYDLRGATLEQRKAQLRHVLLPSGRIRLVEHFESEGEAAFHAAVENGLEGVIAKRRDSTYRSGERTHLWLKVKVTTSDDFVVGGYSRGSGARSRTFGALLLGQYDENGRLRYAGHVGTGFDEETLAHLREQMDALQTDDCPFVDDIPDGPEASWVRPELVAEVKFAQRTNEGRLRSPVFLALRQDKVPREARITVVVAPPAVAAGGEDGRRLDGDEPDAQAIEEVLAQLARPKDKLTLRLQDDRIALANLDKALWPPLGDRRALTKQDLLVYLTKVSPFLLPHLKDRPLTLKRYPGGVSGESFFQKHWGGPLPQFVETVRLFSEHVGGDQDYLLCNNLATLLWLGQVADLELHTWYSRVSPEPDGRDLSTDFTGSLESIEGSLLDYPDFIVFDLDPYIYSGAEKAGEEPALSRKAFAKTREVAQWLRGTLNSLSLPAFVKTSGRTGLHVYVPIVRQFDYESVRAAAAAIGRFLTREHAGDITMEWAVAKRTGKVFFDHNQNARGKTLVSAYSPRSSPEASVSTPLLWEELDDVYPSDFTIANVPDRLARIGDPWRGILSAKHDLRELLNKESFG
ncbi:MAG: DNA ligase D, partial [Dehalococcoidia bacterium]